MEENKKGKQYRRFSLKWKWALGTSIGVFVVFLIFGLLMFRAFTQNDLNRQKREITTALTSVSQRFAKIDAENLTLGLVEPNLQPGNDQVKAIINDDLIANVASKNLTLTIFDRKGVQLLTTRNNQVSMQGRAKFIGQKLLRINGTTILVGRKAIYSETSGKIIGYIQVVNSLSAYHAMYIKLVKIMFVLLLLCLMAISLWGYLLADWLLRPMENIAKTIAEVEKDPQTRQRVEKLERNDELTDLAYILNEMLDRMQRFIDQQSRFVEDVSHELRTPVAIVKGHMELLNRWGKDDPEVLNDSIKASLDEMKRMETLVQEMLDLTRADQVEINFRHEETDVQDVIYQVYDNFKMIHPEFKFSLEDDIYKQTLISIYRNHLEQIMIILSDNAVKYSNNRKEIHFSMSGNAKEVQIAVQDFGEGIEEEDARHVFDRFYRVDKARSREKGGNGLGLSIAQKLIEGYGGKITLESSIGHGSIFRITLPILKKDK
ncbi:HAMP domain-containing sensor histidine kinase [Periweissella beninensis]|uniref:Signal transduction histidine-protein kinase ArlS n=1 Tax=Periweissella beninensis TaxID=504936 RepID=A0ABT0VKC0_9LACO|nr:HAMP domain-containing histidine kinase [Periweissella beninensis]MBM7544079.1 signal transduction histidine kinase [Periweissella beninensis]MCM2437364.1 HAMP domain-containing protein [Periweissella beninensis]MCT4396986.1 sensor histidine kinase [Periweissella beninensis]